MKTRKPHILTGQHNVSPPNQPIEQSQLLIQELISSPFWDDLNDQARKRWLNQLQELME